LTTTYLKNKINKNIKSLPKDKLLVIDDFVSYLSERTENAATKELLEIPGLLAEVQEAKKEFKKGKGVLWDKIRKNV
jgi:hypothetical protein